MDEEKKSAEEAGVPIAPDEKPEDNAGTQPA